MNHRPTRINPWCFNALVSLGLLFPPLYGTTQTRHGIILQLGLAEGSERVIDPNDVMKRSFNPAVPLGAGYVLEKKRFSHTLLYELKSISFIGPHWDSGQFGGGHSTVGRTFVHAATYNIEKHLLADASGLLRLSALAGISLGYLPGRRGQSPYIPSDTTFISQIGGFTGNQGLFTTRYHAGLLSYVSLHATAGLNVCFRMGKHRYGSLIPFYSQGLNDIQQMDIWYRDSRTNTSGHAVIRSRGTFFGVLFRVLFMI